VIALLALAALPCLFSAHGAERAPVLKAAGIERVCVPPERVEEWKAAGFAAVPLSQEELSRREVLLVPGVKPRGADRVSATRSPWLDSNGWRFRREPGKAWAYKLSAGPAALAAAEAFAQGADAVLQIDDADLQKLGQMMAFLKEVPPSTLPDVADVAVVDNGSPFLPEVLNLLARRNLLFKLVPQPSAEFRVNVAIGTAEYPDREAADPSAFALKIRRQHTDEQRALRIFGSEGIIGRLTADGTRARLHLLNYSGRELEGLHIRVRGAYAKGEALMAGAGRLPLADYRVEEGATEFTLPRLGPYGIVDLSPAR
jgi:hypothetical protein